MKDLASRFSEVEFRVRALVAENRALRARVRELERERDTAGSHAREADALRERSAQVRERLQRLLDMLESLEQGTSGEQADLPHGIAAKDGQKD